MAASGFVYSWGWSYTRVALLEFSKAFIAASRRTVRVGAYFYPVSRGEEFQHQGR